MMGSKHAAHPSSVRMRGLVWMSFLLSVWFASSIVSTLINKMLMVHFPYPVTISFVHMLSSVVVDLFIIVSRGLSLHPFRVDIFWQCLPVAATINFGQQPTKPSLVSSHLSSPHLTALHLTTRTSHLTSCHQVTLTMWCLLSTLYVAVSCRVG